MLRKLLLTAAVVTGLSQLHAQTAPSILAINAYGDSCYANTSNINHVGAWGEVSNPIANLNVTTYWGDGLSSNTPVTYQSSFGSFSDDHTYTTPGTYSIMCVLFNASNTALDTSYDVVNAFCNTMLGTVYKKNDANCTYDFGVDESLHFPFQVQVKKNNVPYDTFITNGYYYYSIPNPDLVSEYSFHPLNTAPGYQLACPGTTTPYRLRLDTINMGNNHFDFGYICGSATGFDMYAYMSGFMRFVNNSYLNISVGNAACTPQSGVVTLQLSPKYTYSSANLTPTSVSGQTLTWNLSNLSGSNSPNIFVVLVPATTLTPGDTACHTVNITPTTGDINVTNNSFTFCDSISASLDPNEKHVIPAGNIAAGELLTYTINFENLGNDTAFNVHILDTLSANLELTSFELLNSSHQVRTNILKSGTSNIVRFDFVDIKLADKDHPETNKGFVIYRAKAKNSMQPGDKVNNTAHIYFDINPAVVTNTVTSGIPNPTSISVLTKEDGISIYPNPASSKLFIENQNGLYNKVTMINTLGQIAGVYDIKKGNNEVEISALSSGLYYLIVSGEHNTRSMKITKK